MSNSATAQHLFVADTKVVTIVTDSAICRQKNNNFPVNSQILSLQIYNVKQQEN